MEKQATLRPHQKAIRLHAECINYVGLRRRSNEDSFCLNHYWLEPEQMNDNITCAQELMLLDGVYGVFDGVGGDPHGERASCAAARFFAENRQRVGQVCGDAARMNRFFQEANEAVRQESDGSCTTAALLAVTRASAYIANVGDSSVYLFRGGVLEALGATHHPEGAPQGSHAITRYLGEDSLAGRYHPFVAQPIPLEHGDLFMLCSDGVTDMLPDERISAILGRPDLDDRGRADMLIQQAMSAGGNDNATLILVRVLLD